MGPPAAAMVARGERDSDGGEWTETSGWLYKTLGMPVSATAQDIRKAFRALSLAHHPDKTQGKTEQERQVSAGAVGGISGDELGACRVTRQHGPAGVARDLPADPGGIRGTLGAGQACKIRLGAHLACLKFSDSETGVSGRQGGRR